LAQAKRTYYLYADEGLLAESTQAITLNADGTVTAATNPQIFAQYGPTPDAEFTTGTLFLKTKNSNGQDTVAYYHHDHLQTPIQATDKQGNLVWSAAYEPFGQATITTPSATVDNPTITSNLRLPGQYFDDETGLHYNFKRYYDPSSARYITQDPVGLSGGDNIFIYATANPLLFIDPFGLEVGLLEGMIPVWGSGKQAYEDFQCGRWGWGLFNSVVAISDIFLIKAVATGLAKGAWKFGSNSWSATRSWYGKTRNLVPRTPVHHWAIPRNTWGKNVPNIIKNQPWNLMPMPSQAFHNSVHGWGDNAFNAAERAWYGTPSWAKAAVVSTGGHGVNTGRNDCGCK